MKYQIDIAEATAGDATAIAEIHLTSRREAMPYLRLAHSDDSTRAWFAEAVGDRSGCWWVARCEGLIVGYMLVVGDELDHLYVRPGWQRRRVGLALLLRAKSLSPAGLPCGPSSGTPMRGRSMRRMGSALPNVRTVITRSTSRMYVTCGTPGAGPPGRASQ